MAGSVASLPGEREPYREGGKSLVVGGGRGLVSKQQPLEFLGDISLLLLDLLHQLSAAPPDWGEGRASTASGPPSPPASHEYG